ncbi:MAG: hypothetical protein Q7S00_02690 [bacterium]|nr:hypothetical protein [bacterium]
MKARDILITVFALFTCMVLVSCTGGGNGKPSNITEDGKALLEQALVLAGDPNNLTGSVSSPSSPTALPKRSYEDIKKAYEEAGLGLPPRPIEENEEKRVPLKSEEVKLAALATDCGPLPDLSGMIPGISMEGCLTVDMDESTLEMRSMTMDVTKLTVDRVRTPDGSIVSGSVTMKASSDFATETINYLYIKTLDAGLDVRRPGVTNCEPNLFTCGIITYDLTGHASITDMSTEFVGDATVKAHESDAEPEYCNLKLTVTIGEGGVATRTAECR